MEGDSFLEQLDSMIESRCEFIGDDGLNMTVISMHDSGQIIEDIKDYFADLAALERVRELYVSAFQPQED